MVKKKFKIGAWHLDLSKVVAITDHFRYQHGNGTGYFKVVFEDGKTLEIDLRWENNDKYKELITNWEDL